MGPSFSVVSLTVRRGLCAAHAGLIAVLSLVPVWLFPPSAGGWALAQRVLARQKSRGT